MDHYIVEIYRRGPLGALHGTVERVGNGGRTGFSSAEELCAILQEWPDHAPPIAARNPDSKTGSGKRAVRSKPRKKGQLS